MKIVNPGPEDFHVHTFTYSDGLNTIDEIVRFTQEIGLRKIVLTDHSFATLEAYGYGKKVHRTMMKRWRNVHNDVEVSFGIEADLLNAHGYMCQHIQEEVKEDGFLILSAHWKVYKDDRKTITRAYLEALKKYGNKIDLLGHPCIEHFAEHIDIRAIIESANDLGIPMEFNATNFVNNKTNRENLRIMLKEADQIYVNSDAHTLHELKANRQIALEWLREEGYHKD